MSNGPGHPEQVPQNPARSHRRWWLLALVFGLLGFSLTAVFLRNSHNTSLPPGVNSQEFQLAKESFELKNGRRADQIDTLYWLAEMNLTKHQPTEAIRYFDLIPTSHARYGRLARYQQSRTLLFLHRAVESEEQLRELFKAEEDSPQLENRYLIDARQNLRHILEVELRFEERHQLLRGVIDRAEEDSFEAVAGCFPSLLRWNGTETIHWLEQFREAGPARPELDIALGRYRTGQGRPQEARSLLESVVREQPENLRAVAALVICLHEANDIEGARQLMEALPPQGESDPWWLLIQRGSFHLQNGQAKPAAAAFEQLLRQDRTSTEAWQGLAEASRILNDQPRRKQAIERVTILGRIQNHLGKATLDPSDPYSFLDVADLCTEIDLFREGAIMTRCARRVAPDKERVRSTVKFYQERLAAEKLPALLSP
jgi:tetratricopeptide (TPR) repeat protein